MSASRLPSASPPRLALPPWSFSSWPFLLLLLSALFCLFASFWEVAHYSIYTHAYDFDAYRAYALNVYLHGWSAYYGHYPTFPPPNINPPLLGLLMFPFLLLSPNFGFILWIILSLFAFALACRLLDSTSWPFLLLLVFFFPVVYTLLLGQIVLLVALIIVLSWWLSAHHYPLASGLVLSLCTLKPQLILLLPLVLLFANRKREFLGFALGALLLSIFSFILVGPSGLSALLDAQRYVLLHPSVNYLVPAMIFTLWLPGLIGWSLVLLSALFTLYLAFRARLAPVATVFALGLLGSLLVTPYLHPQDLTLWVLVALFLRRSFPLPPLLLALGLLASWTWVPFSGLLFPPPSPLTPLLPSSPSGLPACPLADFSFSSLPFCPAGRPSKRAPQLALPYRPLFLSIHSKLNHICAPNPNSPQPP